MFRRTISILMLILILSTSISTTEVNAETNLTTKLKENLIPLKTTQAENGFEDFMPLKDILKDKKVIGMGEATHGTKEFFEMKHRMFEFLVEEMGYRVFAIEAEFGGSQIVNDYILHGKGSIGESLDAMKFWTWSTQEVANMVEWMKEYNEKLENKTKIKFYGFDMQFIDQNINHILEYIEKVDAKDKEKHIWRLYGLSYLFETPKDEELIKLKEDIDDLLLNLTNNKGNYISKSSEREYDLILHHIAVINQWIDYNKEPTFNARDKYMAKNVEWILDYETKYNENDKMMLWAHNGHVSKSYRKFISMGENLSKMFGDEYYNIGFDSYKGSFRTMATNISGEFISYDLAKFILPRSSKNTLVYELEKTETPLSYLDFKSSLEDKDIREWLSSKKAIHYIGAEYGGKYLPSTYLIKEIPLESYDGIIFISETSSSVGYKNKNEIKDGDQLISDYYKNYKIIGIVSCMLLIIFIIIYISNKNKK